MMLRGSLALGSLIACLTLSGVSYATDPATEWFSRDHVDPDWALRFRISGSLPDGQEEFSYFVPGIGTIPVTSDGSIFDESALGFEVGGTYFMTDHIAFELTTGMVISPSASLSLTRNVAGGSATAKTDSKTRMIPVTAMAQYMIAPYGDLVPYVGGGYNYTYIVEDKDVVNFDAPHGPVLQVGADWWSGNTGVNFDVRKYFWGAFNGDYNAFAKRVAAPGEEFTSEVDTQPWVLSVGLNYRF